MKVWSLYSYILLNLTLRNLVLSTALSTVPLISVEKENYTFKGKDGT